MKQHPLFVNRVAVLATMYHKEKVIAPILEQELGIKVIVPQDFDTDRFGTFLDFGQKRQMFALSLTLERELRSL